MRFFSLLTAIVVAALLYFFVMERDLVRAIAGAEQPASVPVEEAGGARVGDIVSVVAFRSRARVVESGLVLRGRTEARRKVQVRAETTGTVVSEPLRRGVRVDEGDLLCKLDAGSRPAQLAEAEAVLEEAQANANASESLVQRGFTSETAAISRRATLQAAQARVDQAQRELDRLEIRAPFGGNLENDSAELGALLQPGSECAYIIDLNPVKVIGFAPERLVDQVLTGAAVGVRLLTGKEFTGKVSFVARSADPETRTFQVEAEVPNPDFAIRDGSTAEILVSLEGVKAHLLPQSALTLNDSGELGIRTFDGERARFVKVAIIRDTPEGVWVSGLPDETDVIVVGQDFVTDGQPVDAVFREEGL